MKIEGKTLIMTDSHLSVLSDKLFPIWLKAVDQLETNKEDKELLAISKRLGDIVERVQESRCIVEELCLLGRPEINSVLLESLKKIRQ